MIGEPAVHGDSAERRPHASMRCSRARLLPRQARAVFDTQALNAVTAGAKIEATTGTACYTYTGLGILQDFHNEETWL
jgi:hypothetical protein